MNRFIQVGLSIAIAVTFVSLVGVGINVFVSHPDFDKSYQACGEGPYARPLPADEKMTSEERIEFDAEQKEYQECQNRMTEERHAFEQKIFAIAVLLGAIGVALGVLVFPKMLPVAASGMTFGGLFSILYGMMRGLGAVDRRIMFVAVLVAFFVLLGVAWKRGRAMLHKPETAA